MRKLKIIIQINIVGLLFSFILFNCKSNKSEHKAVSVFNKARDDIADFPVKYRQMSLGARNIISGDTKKDSLRLEFIVTLPGDIKNTLDFIYSVVEIYDKEGLLINRYEKKDLDKFNLIQDIIVKPFYPDTFVIRTWGFGYQFIESKEKKFPKKELIIGTTRLFEQMMPDTSSQKRIQ